MGFGAVRVRWLPLWAVVGAVLVAGLAEFAARVLGIPVSDDMVTAVSYLPILAWVWLMVANRARVDLGVMFRWPRLGSYWFVIAGLFVVQLLFTIGIVTLLELVVPDLAAGLEGVGTANLLVSVVALVVLPPLVEETVFRGILVERWSLRWQVWVAVLVSSASFGVLHVDPVGAGMFGVVLCLVYLRTGSLWPGILMHAANNGVVLLSVRLVGTQSADVTPPSVGESLGAAAITLGLSVPFLAWFLHAAWPRRGTATPYQVHEAELGRFPDRVLGSVQWSGWPAPVRLDLLSDRMAVSPPGRRANPFAVLALWRVRSCYESAGAMGNVVVVVLDDGSWTTLQLPGTDPRASRELVEQVTLRAGAARSGGGALAR